MVNGCGEREIQEKQQKVLLADQNGAGQMNKKESRNVKKTSGKKTLMRIAAVLIACVMLFGQPVSGFSAYASEEAADRITEASVPESGTDTAVPDGEEEDPQLIEADPVPAQDAGEGEGESAETEDAPEAEPAAPGSDGTDPAQGGTAQPGQDAAGNGTDPAGGGNDAQGTGNGAPEGGEENGEENPYEGLPTIGELSRLPDTTAEATMEYFGAAGALNVRGWDLSVRYVNQPDAFGVTKSEAFDLKYQMLFRNSSEIAAGAAEIRMPLSLVTYPGEEKEQQVPPFRVGLKMARPEHPAEDERSFFNYYIDTEKNEIVFFNYQVIPAGTASAWQVLYKNIDPEQAADDAAWSVVPEAVVVMNGTETRPAQGEIRAIEGRIAAADDPEGENGNEPAEGEDADPEEEEADPADEEEEEGEPEELGDLDYDEAGSAGIETDGEALDALASGTANWKFDLYYTGQDDLHYVEKTGAFTLKYNVEFYNVGGKTIDPYCAEIRIPAALMPIGRGDDSRPLLPSDIGIPMGAYDSETGLYTYSENASLFNYYYDENTYELVFFNGEPLTPGFSRVWQVAYSGFKSMDIPVYSWYWELYPRVTVKLDKTIDEETGEISYTVENLTQEESYALALYGQFSRISDSINSLKKSPLETGKSYTPGLYTRNQLSQYAPYWADAVIPGAPAGDNRLRDHFDDYAFVVWNMSFNLTAGQPYQLYFSDEAGILQNPSNPNQGGYPGGFVVSVREYVSQHEGYMYYEPIDYDDLPYGVQNRFYDSGYTMFYDLTGFPGVSKEDGWIVDESSTRSLTIVTAIPKELQQQGVVLQEGTGIYDYPYLAMHLIDDLNYPVTQYQSRPSTWTWKDYTFKYAGDRASLSKSSSESRLNSWKTVHDFAGVDLSTTDFVVNADFRYFAQTHSLTDSEELGLGDYIPGRYVKTLVWDKGVRAWPTDKAGNPTGEAVVLGPEDYYFDKVMISMRDRGYNVEEDEFSGITSGSVTGSLDREFHIEAMFADGSGEMEEVDSIESGPNGFFYEFPDSLIRRHPLQVRVTHNGVDYSTECTITTGVTVLGDSPAFASFADAYAVCIQNNSASTAQVFEGDSPVPGSGNSNIDGNGFFMNPQGLPVFTYNAPVLLAGERKNALARKSGRAYNDSKNSRAVIQYTMEASEGYQVYSRDAIDYLLDAGKQPVSRSEVVFYDLLPFGVQFDPSVPVRAGRLTRPVSDSGTPYGWDTSQVSVTVDPKNDVIQDYRGTGRTLVRFRVSYSGRDASVYHETSSQFGGGKDWFSGFGVSFSAYCSYEDYAAAKERPNIVAYMPGNGDANPLAILGEDGQVSLDDGEHIVSGDSFTKFYKELGKDINGDGRTDTRNVLYAGSNVFTDIAVSGTPGLQIEKTVRAEDDPFDIFKSSTTAQAGEDYEYRISVSNIAASGADELIVFDSIENNGFDAGENWKGAFAGVVTPELSARGVSPVIYYNASADAPFPSDGQDREAILSGLLTEENGWIRSTQWSGELSGVKAVAVDLGSGFSLKEADDVSFRIRMKAPGTIDPDKVWAKNSAVIHGHDKGTDTQVMRSAKLGTKVKLIEAKTFSLEKHLAEGTPAQRANEEFYFTLTWQDAGEKQYYAHKKYTLLKEDGSGGWQTVDGLYSTDVRGGLYLGNGQKAVFAESDASCIVAEEEQSIRWEQKVTDTSDGGTRTVSFENIYHPLLYVKKDVRGYAKSDIPEINRQAFEMRLTDGEGTPVSGKTLYVVSRALTNGDEPVVLDGAHKVFGNLKKEWYDETKNRRLETDDDGIFTIYPGETVAFPVDRAGMEFRVTELSEYYGDSSEWICDRPSDEGSVGINGKTLTITNQYRWKLLQIAKTVESAGNADVSEKEFTFRLYEAKGKNEKGDQITDFQWQLLDSASDEDDPSAWIPAENGEITAACAGKVIAVRRFEVGSQIIVEEVLPEEMKDEFRIVKGSVYVKMPVYATAGKASIVNEWMYRDLDISKIVVSQDPEEWYRGMPFEITLERASERPPESGAEEVYLPAANEVYTLYDGNDRIYTYEDGWSLTPDPEKTEIPLMTSENGTFLIAHGWTARFAGFGREGMKWRARETASEAYPPVTPGPDEADPEHSQYLEGTLSSSNRVEFINGEDDILVIRKKWVGDDDLSEQFLQFVENDARISVYGGTNNSEWSPFDNNWYSVPQRRTRVRVDLDDMPVRIADSRGAFVSKCERPDDPSARYQVPTEISFVDDNAYIIFKLDENYADQFDFSEMEYEVEELNPQETIAITNQNTYYYYGYDQKFREKVFAVNTDRDTIGESSTQGERPVVTLENHLRSFPAVVQKRVDGGIVEPGAELVWKVEQFREGEWVPAEGVQYTSVNQIYGQPEEGFDYGESGSYGFEGSKGVTGSDGIVRISFQTPVMPYNAQRYSTYQAMSKVLVFFDRDVKVNHYNDMKEGDYRVTEVPYASDPSWGLLSRFITSDWRVTYSSTASYVGGDEATGYFNSTIQYGTLTIEKEVDRPTAKPFTFTVMESLSPFENDNMHIGAGIPFVVYDKETGEEVRRGNTTSAGQFEIQGGQYAVLSVPTTGTYRVTEEDCLPYYLDELVVNGETVEGDTRTGEATVLPESEDILHSDMIRSDFGAAVNRLTSKLYGRSPDSIKHVVFGKTEDYPSVAEGESVVLDSYMIGTIRGYLTENSDGSLDLYVLSDDPMYLNTNAAGMFNGNYNNNQGWSSGYTMFRNLESVDFTSNVKADKTVSMSGMFSNASNLSSIPGFAALDTSKVTDMSGMFSGCYALSQADELTGLETSSVRTMAGMFANCNNLNSLEFMRNWDTKSVTDMSSMFSGCNSLMNDDFGVLWGLDTSKVKSMSRMFQGCSNLTALSALSGLDTTSVEDMSYMFASSGLTDLTGAGGWDRSALKSIAGMFDSCYSLASLQGLEGWDVSTVENMSWLFQYDNNITDLGPIAGWDTGNVKDMRGVFYNLNAITDLAPLTGWDVSSVLAMDSMFSQCSSVTSVAPISGWNVSSVRSMTSMFNGCSSLTSADLHTWTPHLNDATKLNQSTYSGSGSLAYLFYGCSNLTYADLSSWDTSECTSLYYLFSNCGKLKEVKLGTWDTSKVTTFYYAFYQCYDLVTADLTNWSAESINSSGLNYVFYRDSKLETIYCNHNWYQESRGNGLYSESSSRTFYNCSKLPGYLTNNNGYSYAKTTEDGGYFTKKAG